MKYCEYEHFFSQKRLNRYLLACNGNKRKAIICTLRCSNNLTHQLLLNAFPYKQRSTLQLHINQSYIFNELDKINTLRNRIAHHEPLCFPTGQTIIYTGYIRSEYQKIQTLFSWMGIDSGSMLYGLDHVIKVCDKIDGL